VKFITADPAGRVLSKPFNPRRLAKPRSSAMHRKMMFRATMDGKQETA